MHTVYIMYIKLENLQGLPNYSILHFVKHV